MMASNSQDGVDEREDTKPESPNRIIKEFLIQREPAFRRLNEIREKVGCNLGSTKRWWDNDN
jgi:hypothetical protein